MRYGMTTVATISMTPAQAVVVARAALITVTASATTAISGFYILTTVIDSHG